MSVVQFNQNMRFCKTCKETKVLTDFHFHKSNNAYMHKCQECHVMAERKRQKSLWENNSDYRELHNAKGQEHRRKTNWKDTRTLKDRVHTKYGVSWEHI